MMWKVNEASLQELRARYNAAYSATRSCVRALTDASTAGEPAGAALLECEAKAQRALTAARGKLIAALSEIPNGD
jgi:hypothetical protein